MEIRYVASGQRCQIYVSCKQTLLPIYGSLLSWTLSHFFSDHWELFPDVWHDLLCFCQVNSRFNFLRNFMCWLLHAKSHRSPRVSCKVFWPPAAKVKPPSPAFCPAGAQTQCSVLPASSALLVWRVSELRRNTATWRSTMCGAGVFTCGVKNPVHFKYCGYRQYRYIVTH